MKLGLGLGLGVGGNRLPRYVTDYFNGFELTGSTYSGGPTVVADNEGTLVTCPADTLPIEGMRLATTVAEGATLGSELSAPTENNEDAENVIENLGGNRYRFVGDGNTATFLRWSVTKGKRYQISLTDVVRVAGSLKCSDLADGDVFSEVISDFTTEDTNDADSTLDVFRNTSGQAIDITATFSVREVIPTWLPTDSSGDPIHTSTPLRTRKGTVSVYDESYKGPLIEPAGTNRVLQSADLTQSAWTKRGAASVTKNLTSPKNEANAACTVSVGALGVDDIYQIVTGVTANSDVSQGIWIKQITTTGTLVIVSPNASATGKWEVDLSKLNGQWERITKAHVAVTVIYPFVATFQGAAGLLFCMVSGTGSFGLWNCQQQESIYLGSDIVTTATTVTRPAANLTRPTAGTALAALNNWGIRLRFRPTAAGQTAVLWGSYTDADNATRLDLAPTTLTYTKRLAGADHVAQTSLTHAADTLYEALFYQHSVHGMGIATRSWNGSAWSSWSTWVDLTDANGIANASIATTYQNGAVNNSSHVCANLPFVEVITVPASVEPQAWLMSQLAKGRI